MPSIKLMMFVVPTHTISAIGTIHHISQFIMPIDQNINAIATNCATNRTLSGSECTSSMKLTPAIKIRPAINGRYGMIFCPCTTISTAQAIMLRLKMIPPPRSTIVECELRSFGLSIILHLSAILKYTNSATTSSTAIIIYFNKIFIMFILIRYYFSKPRTSV